MTAITRSHWIELVIRSVIFILTICGYVLDKISDIEIVKEIANGVILVFFTYKMIARLIPNVKESIGNQKIFKKNYIPTKKGIMGYNKKDGNKVAIAVAIVWLLLNCNFFILYFCDVFDRDFMMVISIFFSVCDLICVLLVCPFQRFYLYKVFNAEKY